MIYEVNELIEWAKSLPEDAKINAKEIKETRMMMYERNIAKGIDDVHSYPPLKCSGEPMIKINYNQ